MGIVVIFGEMPSLVFSGFFGAKLQKTSRCLQRHRNTAVGAVSQLWIPTGERSVVVDANRGHGQRFVVHADEKLTAFLELEKVPRESLRFQNAE